MRYSEVLKLASCFGFSADSMNELDERSFVYPDEFIPERWSTKPELVKDASVFIPFGAGTSQTMSFPPNTNAS